MEIFFTAIGLGLAGIDIFGVIVIVAALSARVSKWSILVFAITTFVATVLVGVSLSLFLGSSVGYVSNFIHRLPDYLWVIIDCVLVVMLISWAIMRMAKKPKIEKRENEKSWATKWIKNSLFVVGLLYALSALTDPSFLALVALAGHNSSLIGIIGSHVLWILISQAALFIFTGAVMFNKHKSVLAWFDTTRVKYSKQLSIALTVIITLVGLTFLADLVSFITTSRWLFA